LTIAKWRVFFSEHLSARSAGDFLQTNSFPKKNF
jgi:hypothetical protein